MGKKLKGGGLFSDNFLIDLIYWIVIVSVIVGAVVATLMLTLPKKGPQTQIALQGTPYILPGEQDQTTYISLNQNLEGIWLRDDKVVIVTYGISKTGPTTLNTVGLELWLEYQVGEWDEANPTEEVPGSRTTVNASIPSVSETSVETAYISAAGVGSVRLRPNRYSGLVMKGQLVKDNGVPLNNDGLAYGLVKQS